MGKGAEWDPDEVNLRQRKEKTRNSRKKEKKRNKKDKKKKRKGKMDYTILATPTPRTLYYHAGSRYRLIRIMK